MSEEPVRVELPGRPGFRHDLEAGRIVWGGSVDLLQLGRREAPDMSKFEPFERPAFEPFTRAFNPDQPRDDSGRWTDALGGAVAEVGWVQGQSLADAANRWLKSDKAHAKLARTVKHWIDEYSFDLANVMTVHAGLEEVMGEALHHMSTHGQLAIETAGVLALSHLRRKLGVTPSAARALLLSSAKALRATVKKDEGQDQEKAFAAMLDALVKYWEGLSEDELAELAKAAATTGFEPFMRKAFDPNQPRDEQGRWTDTGAVNIRGDLSYTAQGSLDQPVSSLDELYDRAKAGEAAFKEDVDNVASRAGGDVMYTPPEFAEPGTSLKSRQSAERKLRDELSNDPTQLRDVLRATIVNESVEQSRVAAATFIKEHGPDILRVKDRYVKSVDGYRDILINYRTKSGLVAEIQFNSRELIRAKLGEGHKLYEQIRRIQAGSALTQFALGGAGGGSGQGELLHALTQRSMSLYERAYQADGNGNWGTMA